MLALRQYARTLFLVSIALFSGLGARAATLERLIMPGALSKAHGTLEDDCSVCHDRASRERQTTLCLECHKEIAADIRTLSRYHGRIPEAGKSQCSGCHSEHHGRDADITGFNPSGFPHELTQFALLGAHRTLTCVSCHRSDTAYRNTPTACIACHKKDDTHRDALGVDCARCHEAASWQKTHFDHATTGFPLTNKHAESSCAACHPGERYKGVPTTCIGCHAPDDVHKGSQGTECSNCHSTAQWGAQKFDHNRETGFALLGRHAHLGCSDCHRSGNVNDPIAKTCNGCHNADDPHLSRMGPACETCHGNDAWHIAAYEHKAFPLQGAHARLDCHTCHTGPVKEQKLPTDCAGCHRADEPHGGSLGKDCQTCHSTLRWAEVEFDHDLTQYPLLGLHVAVTCGQCHPNQHFRETPQNCNGCHAKADAHKGALGKDCGACHTPNAWKLGEFDHAARTRFPLSGAHAAVACAQCHIRPQNLAKPSMVCGSCHAENDVHAGRFGTQCQQCHTTSSFKRPRTN